jgi:transcriptional regulator
MYSPPYNRNDDRAEQVEFMRANNFALLVTGSGGELAASHLPCVVEERGAEIAIVMHMARANPLWETFFDDDALVVFGGPHGYISPRWYEDRPRVPTWNYAAVHAYGRVSVLPTREARHGAIAKLVAQHDPQWLDDFAALPEIYLDSMLDNIVAFEVAVSRLETRWKLSQNRGRREQELIVAELEKSSSEGDRALAALTRRHFV